LAAFGAPAWADAAADIRALESICRRRSLPQDWQSFLGNFDGPIAVELTDFNVTADRNLAYSHSMQRVSATDK
jgi:hypothetical protein